MLYNQHDILTMRQIIADNLFDDTCRWSVDDLTDIEVIHLYKSYFEDEELFYCLYEEGEDFEF